jgi:hypothetical protein
MPTRRTQLVNTEKSASVAPLPTINARPKRKARCKQGSGGISVDGISADRNSAVATLAPRME